MKQIFTTLALVAALPMLQAQWSKATMPSQTLRKVNNASYYKLDINKIRTQLQNASVVGKGGNTITVSIPTQSGKIEKFAVNSFPVMDEALATKYQLGSYVGVGIDDPKKVIRFSVAPNDFQSMIIGDGKYEFIEPATEDKEYYSVHTKTNKNESPFDCKTTEKMSEIMKIKQMQEDTRNANLSKASDKKYHTLRLAISVTGEYTDYFKGVAGALTQINATMSRVNGVFEQEFNVHLNVINAPSLIFTDASTDPYSPSEDMDNWNLQLMNTLHGGKFGVTDADFDIGHLFGASGGGGMAGCLTCVCSNDTSTYVEDGITYPANYKGSGYTSPSDAKPFGDSFDIDYVAHEMGHQMGGSHNHSRYEQYLNKEVEPGTGSTIMAYAGLWGASYSVQPHSDPYFSFASIEQVQAHMASISCDVETAITNNPPVIQPMSKTYTIPKGTAFVLTAKATDPDGDALTYTWEQADPSKISNGISKTNIGTTTSGGNFRSWAPNSSPTRYFPKLSTVLSGVLKNTNDFEAVSTVARTSNFRVTVRDNKIGGQAQTATANQVVVVGAAAAFTVSTASGSPETPVNVSWVVSGTTASPYNVANVKIDFTADNGTTWSTLSESVPNNGSTSVKFPASTANKTVIVRVSAIDNIFYAVNKVTLGALGVNDINRTSVQLYPNPASDILNVTNVSAKTAYKIFNITGQLVSTGNINNGEVKVNQLVKGAYIISFEDKGNVSNIKFEKK